MSVLIKGMDMPKAGWEQIIIMSDGKVFLLRELTAGVVKHEYKAVKVPAPHGRLIDADVILAQLSEMSLDDCSLVEDLIEHGIFDVLDDAPTIIESEEGT